MARILAAIDDVTTLIEMLEKDLVEPRLLSIFDAEGLKVALLETIELLSAKLYFLQAFLEECKTKMNNGDKIHLHESLEYTEYRIGRISYKTEIEYKLRRVYLADNGKGYVFEASKKLHQTLKQVVSHIEGVEEWFLAEKRRIVLEPEKANITTVWDTYQNALVPENEVIVGFKSDIEMIINRLCYSHLMRSVFTILMRNSNIDNFGKDVCHSKCKLVYPCLKLLRVLDLSLVKWSRGVPNEVTDLVHLRYLALSTIGSLSEFQFFKLKNLVTLIVTSWMEKCPLQLPCDILDLPQLRYLHVDKRCSQYLPCFVKKDLQTLYWLKVASFDEKPNFGMVPNLRELGIFIEGQLAPSYLGSLVYLHLLEKLKFEVGRVERFYLPTGFPPNLKKLTLRYTYLPWKEMDTIGELLHLEVLKLKDFAFCGSKWKPSKLCFRKLKALLISRSNLKHWHASSNHFPVLERIVLRYCWELEQVPLKFAKIRALKLIVLECCYSSLVTSAKEISSAKRLLFEGMDVCPLRVHKVGTKLLRRNCGKLEEESVDSYEEESVERSKEESVKYFEEKSVGSSHQERFKAEKRVMKTLKKKVSKSLAFKD
nr:putative late blight resistance protein homolog R1B-17 [Ipomoea batatas]